MNDQEKNAKIARELNALADATATIQHDVANLICSIQVGSGEPPITSSMACYHLKKARLDLQALAKLLDFAPRGAESIEPVRIEEKEEAVLKAEAS